MTGFLIAAFNYDQFGRPGWIVAKWEVDRPAQPSPGSTSRLWVNHPEPQAGCRRQAPDRVDLCDKLPANVLGEYMKAPILYRIAAVLLLLFAAGHTLGFRQPDPTWGVDALLGSMW
jgi:hypothetical protein